MWRIHFPGIIGYSEVFANGFSMAWFLDFVMMNQVALHVEASIHSFVDPVGNDCGRFSAVPETVAEARAGLREGSH